MDSLRATADRLDSAADAIADLGHAVARDELSVADFGADAPGWLGEVGRALHRQWAAALDDRRDESADAASRLVDLAGLLRTAASGYADIDHAAARRHPEEI